MKYQLEKKDGFCVVRVESDHLTHTEAPDMKTTFLQLLTEDCDILLLNLASVAYMDSTGLGALLFGIRQAEANDKEIIFCCLGEKLKSLVRIARLESILEIYASEKDAVKEIMKDLSDD
ncbi:STAS domain-containing protein [bacterium]|nr:STAS domain-containing protein [bacterium]